MLMQNRPNIFGRITRRRAIGTVGSLAVAGSLGASTSEAMTLQEDNTISEQQGLQDARQGSAIINSKTASADIDHLFAKRIFDGAGLATGVSETGEFMVFSPSPGRIIFVDEDGNAELHDTGFWSTASYIKARESTGLIDIAWIDQDVVVTAERDGQIVYAYESADLWDVDSTTDMQTHVVVTSPVEGEGALGYGQDGEVQWTTRLEDSVGETVAISAEGAFVIVGCGEYQMGTDYVGWNGVQCFDDSGSLLWQHETDMMVLSVGIHRDGNFVVAGTNAGTCVALDLDGSELWKTEEIGAWVKLADDGESVASSPQDGRYVCLDTEGELVREVDTGLWAGWDFEISEDGSAAIIADRTEELVVVKENEIIWDTSHDSGPAIGAISGDGESWSVMVQDNEEEDSLLHGYRIA